MKINTRALVTVLISLIDDAAIITLIVFVLSRFGFSFSWWFIGSLAVVFIAWISLGYWGMRKNPTLYLEIPLKGKDGPFWEESKACFKMS